MSSISTLGLGIAQKQRLNAGSTRGHSFTVSGDEGKATVKIFPPSTSGYDGGSVNILFDGKLYKTVELPKGDRQIKYIVKVLDKGSHTLHVHYAATGYDRVWYSASLELASVIKPPPAPPPVERGCFLFAIGLILFRIFMAVF